MRAWLIGGIAGVVLEIVIGCWVGRRFARIHARNIARVRLGLPPLR